MKSLKAFYYRIPKSGKEIPGEIKRREEALVTATTPLHRAELSEEFNANAGMVLTSSIIVIADDTPESKAVEIFTKARPGIVIKSIIKGV